MVQVNSHPIYTTLSKVLRLPYTALTATQAYYN